MLIIMHMQLIGRNREGEQAHLPHTDKEYRERRTVHDGSQRSDENPAAPPLLLRGGEVLKALKSTASTIKCWPEGEMVIGRRDGESGDIHRGHEGKPEGTSTIKCYRSRRKGDVRRPSVTPHSPDTVTVEAILRRMHAGR